MPIVSPTCIVVGETVTWARVVGGGGMGANVTGADTMVVATSSSSYIMIEHASTAQSTQRASAGTYMSRRNCTKPWNDPSAPAFVSRPPMPQSSAVGVPVGATPPHASTRAPGVNPAPNTVISSPARAMTDVGSVIDRAAPGRGADERGEHRRTRHRCDEGGGEAMRPNGDAHVHKPRLVVRGAGRAPCHIRPALRPERRDERPASARTGGAGSRVVTREGRADGDVRYARIRNGSGFPGITARPGSINA